ncbi:MAG: PQQ-dependent sugar dehydrogenase [Gammaproteobacteria bacterium]
MLDKDTSRRVIALLGLGLFIGPLLTACGGSSGGGPSASSPPTTNPPTTTVGLDARPANATCIAPSRATGGGTIAHEDAFPTSPGFALITKILQAPGDASRWFVLEKSGRVRVFDTATPNDVDTFLDFSGAVRTNSEGGMLGMAFDPNFPATPEVYVSYTAPGNSMLSVVSRVVLDDTDDPVNPTEQVILTVDQPNDNHNGGDIAFGPDGYLYFGVGDGGGSGDPDETGQDTTRLLGSMLRIDVRGVAHPTPGYNIPGDNPFAANPRCGPGTNAAACPEIYAWGLRNPWRWSFDAPTGQLWLGDVGQNEWEEIDIIERGGNYGWDDCEGFANFEANNCPAPAYVDPVTVYRHSNGNNSVTGGYVYRGSSISSLVGRYVFADYVSGRIWALADDGQGGFTNEELLDTPFNISSFAIGADGELYFSEYAGAGGIRRLTLTGGGMTDPVPNDLADTGCADPADVTQPAAGLVPYTVNAPFWSDGANKTRYLAVPDAGTIDVDGAGEFDFPTGSVLVKSFALGSRLVETRLLMRHPDGAWAGYTYEWNDQQTAATRVVGGKTVSVVGQDWIFPSEGECMQCHTVAAGFALGPEIAQLNGDLAYPAPGRTANQLDTLEHIGMLSTPLAGATATLPALADPADMGATADARARAYLHTNCAQCHRPGGPTPTTLDLRFDTALVATGACDELPQSGDLGITDARIIAPGDAARSVRAERLARRDAAAMPPVGSALADANGVALIGGWIDSLAGCTP